MGGDSLFSRPGDGASKGGSDAGDDLGGLGDLDDFFGDDASAVQEPPRGVGRAEGVRVIGPSEAAEAVEKGAAVRRKAGDEPRLGDRPSAPPADVVPVLRFPLAESEDPSSIERPRPTSVGPSEPRLSSVSDATGQHPVISIGSPTGETELPHWTASATGEVPRVLIGDASGPGEDEQAWSTYAATGPRWRDQSADWDEASFADLAADLAEDDSVNVGALSSAAPLDDAITHDEFLGFDDLEVPEAAPPRADLSRVTARGTATDPIRIGSADMGAAQQASRAAAQRSRPQAFRPPAATGERSSGAPRDVRSAVIYGVGIAATAAVCFALGEVPTTLYVTAILLLSAGEFFQAVRKKGFAPLAPLGLAAVVALPFAALAKGEAGIPLVLFLTIVVGAVWYIAGVATEHPLANIGITLLGVVYIGVLGSFAMLIVQLPPNIGDAQGEQGISVLLLAVFATVGYDVAGFTLGRKFGKRPLSKVSPNKTVEGLALGCLASILAVLLFGQIWGPLEGSQLLVLALACAVIAPIGDLTESLMKRDLGIKDFSDLIPGHGGFLDRFDGLFFVLPTTYYVTRALLQLT